MMSNPRAAYLGASVSTASPARLLVMLCERLVLDVTRGRNAQADGDYAEAHRQLLHAQEIVLELRMSLDVKVWDGGPALASIYDFLHAELVRIRDQGYAVDDQENETGINCIALPVHLTSVNRPSGAISVSALVYRRPLQALVDDLPTIRTIIDA